MKAPSKAKVKETANNAVKTTAKAAKSTGNFISKNPKATLYLGLGILGVFVGYKLLKGFNKVGNTLSDLLPDASAGGGKLTDISTPDKVFTGATINLVQAQTLAANILSAMDGIGGLSESEYKIVENALRNKTPKDYQLISDAFGTVPRDPFTGGQTFSLLGQKLNLTQWLTQELKDNQKIRLQEAAPLIF